MKRYYQPKGCPVHGMQYIKNDIETPKLGIDDKEYIKIYRQISEKTIIHPKLYNYTYKILSDAIEQTFSKVKEGDDSYDLVQQFKRNISKFAAYKSAWQTEHLRKAKESEIPNINNAYNVNYTRTEYVHTVRSSRSAKKWQKYEQDIEVYPYLEYMPSQAAEPRNEHKKLYGIVRPVNHPVWDVWLPPADWGCMCSVKQRRRNAGAAKQIPENIKLPPETMRNNPAKTGEIITNKHPMIKNTTKNDRKKIDNIEKELFQNQKKK